jgi:hypothetical protein
MTGTHSTWIDPNPPPPPKDRRPTVVLTIAAVLFTAIILAVLVGVVFLEREERLRPEPSVPTISQAPSAPTTTAAVDPYRSTVSQLIDGVRVSATQVADQPSPSALTISAAAATPASVRAGVGSGPAVQVSLGAGIQPQSPITLRFDLSTKPDLVAQFTDTVRPIIQTASDTDPSVTDLLPATWDPSSRTVTATTGHLSIFQVIAADFGKVADAAKAVWQNVLGTGTVNSSCRDNSRITIGSAKLTLTPSNPGPVAGCLHDTGNGVGITFTNGTKQFYDVASTPSGGFAIPALTGSDDQIIAFIHGLSSHGSGLLTPQGSGDLTLPAATTSATIKLDVDPVALQLKTIVAGVDMLGIDSSQLLNLVQNARSVQDCWVSAAGAGTASKNVDDLRHQLAGIASCGLSAAEASGGKLGSNVDTDFVLHRFSVALTMLTTLPDQLLANITGAVGEITGANHLEFTLTGESPTTTTTAPPAAATPNIIPVITLRSSLPGDSGAQLGPNHFQLGHKLKHNGRFYVSLHMRWHTDTGKGVGDCTEHVRIVDGNGNLAYQNSQTLSVCDNGGNWAFDLTDPGPYTCTVDLEPRNGVSPASKSAQGQLQFTVDG